MRHSLWVLMSGLFLTSGAWAAGRPSPPLLPPPVPSTGVVQSTGLRALSVIWAPSSSAEVNEAAGFLKAHPEVRWAFLLPEKIGVPQGWEPLRSLIETHQLEPLLTLPHRPLLAAWADESWARAQGLLLESHPEDVSAALLQARNRYRRLWKRDPALMWLSPPLLAGPELGLMAQVGLRGVMLLSSGTVGLCGDGLLPVTSVKVLDDVSGPRGGAILDEWKTLGYPPARVTSLQDLLWLSQRLSSEGHTWEPLWVSSASVSSWPRRSLTTWANGSPWTSSPAQQKAWRLWSFARKAVADYQNSGSGEVPILDNALKVVWSASSADIFDGLSSEAIGLEESQRDFMASLDAVYQLLRVAPPVEFSQGFSGHWSENPAVPFHEKTDTGDAWNDPAGDDHSAGNLVTNSLSGVAPGSMDLRRFSLGMSSGALTLEVTLGGVTLSSAAPYGFDVTLVDVYIDINRLPAAGSTGLLPGRPGRVENLNAWEYALSLDGWGARLYQNVPGKPPRRMVSLPVLLSSSTVIVEIPTRLMRGNPKRWSLAVVVMGRSPGPAVSFSDWSPQSGAEPWPWNGQLEGGVGHGGDAEEGEPKQTPFVDILADKNQADTLGITRGESEVVLPFVRTDE